MLYLSQKLIFTQIYVLKFDEINFYKHNYVTFARYETRHVKSSSFVISKNKILTILQFKKL